MNDVVVVNENDEVVGTMPKKEAHLNNTPHRIAVIYVENGKGEILVQHRIDDYLDHSSAGHVEVGESYLEAATRELSEELGIRNGSLRYIGHGETHGEKYPGKTVSHVFDIFACKADPGILQPDEVKEVYWAKPRDVVSDMQTPENKGKYCGGFLVSLPVYLKAIHSNRP